MHREIDRLLASLDDWREASEAVEPEMHKRIELLLNVCRARIAGGHGQERERLEQLRLRLQEDALREASMSDPETQLEELQSLLRSMHDPAAVLATVEGLLGRLQRTEEGGTGHGAQRTADS